MIEVVPAKLKHIFAFLKDIRSEDIEEVEVAAGKPFMRQLPYFLTNFHRLRAVVDGETVLGIGGIESTYVKGTGVIWLLMTYAVETRKVAFLRFSRRYLKELLTQYNLLTNAVYLKNTLHVNWLTWLGAEWVEKTKRFAVFVLRKRGDT